MNRHDTSPLTAEEQHPHRGEWLRDIVFGLNDGLVTTLVFIMVVNGVAAGRVVLVALGEVIAGGLSMALGAYLSAETASDIRDYRIAMERHEIRNEPDEERAELRDLYRRKGFRGGMLDGIVDHLTADEERWLQAMMRDEHGMVEENHRHPITDGLLVGLAFVAGGIIPVLPYLLPVPYHPVWSYVLTALTALVFGALKSRYTLRSPQRSALQFLIVVTIGTVVGAGLGLALHAV